MNDGLSGLLVRAVPTIPAVSVASLKPSTRMQVQPCVFRGSRSEYYSTYTMPIVDKHRYLSRSI